MTAPILVGQSAFYVSFPALQTLLLSFYNKPLLNKFLYQCGKAPFPRSWFFHSDVKKMQGQRIKGLKELQKEF
ncbi:hypothetical protein [Flavobacterium piscisymbiosum]|uniref:Uncharacterized protein n=1 Tax=Flavobacterium piscisymbiosum TaxID=2893753 RepID=A0ABS8M7I4_9FLAO|nr:hypothetical protein [Flavobacterium sp. F-30]MCC9061433.1 hypothetical protein [Flavobacterium sp. F-30]